MSHKGNVQLLLVMTAKPDQVAEGDRIFAEHAKWMPGSHQREGDKELISYDVSKAEEMVNPLDPSAGKTGNTHFILSEVYATAAGVADHMKQSQETFPEFEAFVKWVGECNSTVILGAEIVKSLW
ncbi:MAG: putative quinol monooxygenase [Planctomycetota bacterium]|jgi:hypothetical protein